MEAIRQRDSICARFPRSESARPFCGRDSIHLTNTVCNAPAEFKVGDAVQILYDPGNPQNAQVQGLMDEYVGTLNSGLIGLPFFLVGIGGFVATQFMTNRMQSFSIQTARWTR